MIGGKLMKLLGHEISHKSIKPSFERLEPLLNLPLPRDLKPRQHVIGLFAHYSQWMSHNSDKIQPLVRNRAFRLLDEIASSCRPMKDELSRSVMSTVDPKLLFIVDTDTSDVAIATVITRNGRPVAFFHQDIDGYWTTSFASGKGVIRYRRSYPKVATLFTCHTLSAGYGPEIGCLHVWYIPSVQSEDDKSQRRCIELFCYIFNVVYRGERENTVASTLSRGHYASTSGMSLKDLHESPCHPGTIGLAQHISCDPGTSHLRKQYLIVSFAPN